MMDALQRVAEIKREDRELRLALVASGRVDDLSELFDEFKEVITDDDAEIDDGADEEGNPISTKYDFSNVQLDRSQTEVEKEIAEMLADIATGRATFEDPQYSDWI